MALTDNIEQELDKFERFAKEHYGVRLTRHQLDIYKHIISGRSILYGSRQMGLTTYKKIMDSYIRKSNKIRGGNNEHNI